MAAVRDAVLGRVPYVCPRCRKAHRLARPRAASELHTNSSVTIECPKCGARYTWWYPFEEQLRPASGVD